MSTEGFSDMLAALRWAMPEWSGFDDPRLYSREIQAKREAVHKARDLLGRAVMEQLISQGNWDESLNRLESIGKSSDLLWNRVPTQGAMSILYADNLDRESYTKQVYDLLYGPDDAAARLGRYVSYVDARQLPNRWVFPTYLLFMLHPETEIFVKPPVIRWFLEQAGEERPWESSPSAEFYRTIKHHVARFGEFLASYSPTDMIDLQSAIYMAKSEMERMREPAVWWVNQGRTYKAARDGGFLWAPLLNKKGRTVYHWESMDDVRPGDMVLHYSGNALRAVSRVSEAATLRTCPPEIAGDQWQAEGRYVKTDYAHFDQPIPIETITQHEEARTIPRGPITSPGTVKQGYLFPFTVQALAKVVVSATVDWPDYVRDLLRGATTQDAWVFQANPESYDVMGAVKNLDELTWTVRKHAGQIRSGDKAYIWESGRDAGVIAVGKVLSDPEQMTLPEEEEPYFRDRSLAGSEPVLRVRIAIDRVLPNRITREQFREHEVLSQVSILKQPQGAIFPLTAEQAAALDEIIKGQQEVGRIVRVGVALSLWQAYREHGYISIGWQAIGDLRQYSSFDKIAAAVHQYLAEECPTQRQRESVARQLWLFRTLQPGDEIIATQGTSAMLASGRVQEPGYRWDGEDIGHIVAVAWDETVARRVCKQPHWRVTVVEEADSDLAELVRTPGSGFPPPFPDLATVCNRFARALTGSHIHFGRRHDEVATSFVVSLTTKPFVILTGLSGSGKTLIAVRFGEWLGPGRSLVVAVRPDWTGPEALFGYEDALQAPDEQGRRPWHVPEALALMLKAARDPEHPYLLVLDEMNLAHVERYFADVLSGMESEQPVLPNLIEEDDGRWRLQPDGPERIAIPDNLFVVGTVNVDETTYMFSPKVLDRANTLEFQVDSDDLTEMMRRPTPIEPGEPALVRGFLAMATDPDGHLEQSAVDLSRFTGYLRTLHRILADSHVQFGHRVVYEANRFAALLASAGVAEPLVALDLQVLQKVLPRVHGSRKRLEPVLRALGRFCFDPDQPFEETQAEHTAFDPEEPPAGEPKLPRSFGKVRRMMRSLRADQFVSFTE
ncbi:MAG: EVE domain-containing protein [Limnochordia bacterium]|jgi:predicted RNA-binding protein with PUA-like domain/MoxR-like ATPase